MYRGLQQYILDTLTKMVNNRINILKNKKITMKKFDKKEVNNLIKEIEKEMAKKTAKREDIPLSLKQNNIVKGININWSYSKKGKWNGYGYEQLGKHLEVCNFVKARNALKKLPTENKTVKTITAEQKQERWIMRLSKLTGKSLKIAKKIAEEKVEYHEDKIIEIGQQHTESAYKLARKLERQNPLRYLKNKGHAFAVLAASERHNNTNYEDKLEEAKEKVEMGELEREEVKNWARINKN